MGLLTTCTRTNSDGKANQVQPLCPGCCRNLLPWLLVVQGFMWGEGNQSLNELWGLMAADIVNSGA